MACFNGEVASTFPSGRWEEFCKDRAVNAAKTFSREFLQFVNDNPVYDVSGASYTFSKRFVEYFLESFNQEVHKNGLDDVFEPESPTEVFGPDDWGSNIHLTGNFKQSPEKKDKENAFSFMRKLRDVKDLFKRSVDDGHSAKINTLPAESTSNSGIDQHVNHHTTAEKHKTLKINTSTIRKEAVMSYLMNLDQGVDTEDFFWQKCRVVILKAPGGYMLEFYCPPKVFINVLQYYITQLQLQCFTFMFKRLLYLLIAMYQNCHHFVKLAFMYILLCDVFDIFGRVQFDSLFVLQVFRCN